MTEPSDGTDSVGTVPRDVPGRAERLRAAPRTGRWVQLLPVTLQAVDFLYRLAIDEESGFRWRLVGTVPTIEAFRESLWTGVLTQFVVTERTTGTAVGTVAAYAADLNHGYAYVGAAMTDGVQESGLGIEGVLLFCQYLFATWRLRKLYFDVPEYNLRTVAGTTGGLLREEGRLRAHTHYAGRYWDRVTFALYQDDLAASPLLAGRFAPRRGAAPRGPVAGDAG
jgi:RimJ/RimL family protein N-acetyltransferase